VLTPPCHHATVSTLEQQWLPLQMLDGRLTHEASSQHCRTCCPCSDVLRLAAPPPPPNTHSPPAQSSHTPHCASQVLAYVNRVRDIDSNVDHDKFTLEDVESNMVRCPDQEAAQKMIDGGCGCVGGWGVGGFSWGCKGVARRAVTGQGRQQAAWQLLRSRACQAKHTAGFRLCPLPAAINDVRVRGESCGGEVTCVVRHCPKGLGAPVFDKLEAELAKAMMRWAQQQQQAPGLATAVGPHA